MMREGWGLGPNYQIIGESGWVNIPKSKIK